MEQPALFTFVRFHPLAREVIGKMAGELLNAAKYIYRQLGGEHYAFYGRLALFGLSRWGTPKH